MRIPICPFDALIENVWQHNKKELEESFKDLLRFGETSIKDMHGKILRTHLGAFQNAWQVMVRDWSVYDLLTTMFAGADAHAKNLNFVFETNMEQPKDGKDGTNNVH